MLVTGIGGGVATFALQFAAAADAALARMRAAQHFGKLMLSIA